MTLPSDEEILQWAQRSPDVPAERIDPDTGHWRWIFCSLELVEVIDAALEKWGSKANPILTPAEILQWAKQSPDVPEERTDPERGHYSWVFSSLELAVAIQAALEKWGGDSNQ